MSKSKDMLFNIIPSNFMEPSHPWEANRYWVSREILRILWNPIIREIYHYSRPYVRVLSKN